MPCGNQYTLDEKAKIQAWISENVMFLEISRWLKRDVSGARKMAASLRRLPVNVPPPPPPAGQGPVRPPARMRSCASSLTSFPSRGRRRSSARSLATWSCWSGASRPSWRRGSRSRPGRPPPSPSSLRPCAGSGFGLRGATSSCLRTIRSRWCSLMSRPSGSWTPAPRGCAGPHSWTGTSTSSPWIVNKNITKCRGRYLVFRL